MADSGRTTVVDPRTHPFSLQPKSDGILRTEMTQHLSIGGIVSNPEFVVQAGSGMISLSESFVEMDLKLHRADGTEITEPLTNARPECLFPELLFSDVDLYVNSTQVSDDNGGVYPWKAFARWMITAGEGAGNTGLGIVAAGGTATGDIPNYPPAAGTDNQGGAITTPANLYHFVQEMQQRGYTQYLVLTGRAGAAEHIANATNSTALALYAKIYENLGPTFPNGKEYRMSVCWQPQEGFWQQPNFIPASSDVRVTLQKAAPTLCMRQFFGPGGADPVVGKEVVVDYASSRMSLFLRRYHLTPDMREQISARLLQGPMHYPMTRARVSRSQISAGQTSVSESALMQGQRPGIVAVMFVPQASLNKAPGPQSASSPWILSNSIPPLPPGTTYSQGISCSSIYVQWNERQIPQRPYTSTDQNRPSIRAYCEYVRLCGDAGPCLNYDQWASAYSVYYFDLSKDGSGDEYAPGAEDGTGSLSVFADFTEAAGAGSMIVVGFGASHVTYDAAGNVRRLMF
jgi:hypothetical protein